MQQFHSLLTMTEPLFAESFCVRPPGFDQAWINCERAAGRSPLLFHAANLFVPLIFHSFCSLVSVYLCLLLSPPLSLSLSCFHAPSHSLLSLLPSCLQSQQSARHSRAACYMISRKTASASCSSRSMCKP